MNRSSRFLKKYLVFFTLLIFLGACQAPHPETAQASFFSQKNDKKISKKGFAVVELFTSEGCSSCPPADKLSGQIVRKAAEQMEEVYVLAYHVDYWNYLGWKDQYSSPEYTKRQYWYARKFGSSRVYTPQMVVNGEVEFVGSRGSQAESQISQALKSTRTRSQDLILSRDKGKIYYEIKGDLTGQSLRYALVEKEASTQVRAGENRGAKLYHYNIVKDYGEISTPK
ncbi:MAG: DUF1223 domain-containing protein, partial [Bacteroidota bacterium]